MARAMNSVWIILGFQFLRRISPWRIKSVFQIPHPGLLKKPGFLSMTQKWPKNTWIPQTTNIETDGQSTRSSSPKMADFRASIACASSSWTPACSMSGFPVVWGKGKLMKLMASNASYGWWEKIRLTTGENIASHGIFLFTAAGAGFCQQHVEIARRYPVLFR